MNTGTLAGRRLPVVGFLWRQGRVAAATDILPRPNPIDALCRGNAPRAERLFSTQQNSRALGLSTDARSADSN